MVGRHRPYRVYQSWKERRCRSTGRHRPSWPSVAKITRALRTHSFPSDRKTLTINSRSQSTASLHQLTLHYRSMEPRSMREWCHTLDQSQISHLHPLANFERTHYTCNNFLIILAYTTQWKKRKSNHYILFFLIERQQMADSCALWKKKS